MSAPPLVNTRESKRVTWPASLPGSTACLTACTGANIDGVLTLAGSTQPNAQSVGQGSTNPPTIISGVWWSYSGTPTGGRLLVQAGGQTFLDVDITAGGPGFLPIDPPVSLAAGTQLTVTLKAGGSGVTGKVGANVWQEY